MIPPTREAREELYQRIKIALKTHQSFPIEDLTLLLACISYVEERLVMTRAELDATLENLIRLEHSWREHLQQCFTASLTPTVEYRCGACRGRGRWHDEDGDVVTCETCHGTGVIK